MQSTTQISPLSKGKIRTGYIISGIAVLFILFDGIIKVIQIPPAVEGTVQLGYPASLLLAIGILELACVIAYLIPRTSILGAILMTGYLGGAIATHVRIGNPLFSHILFPVYIALMLWGGLFLRDVRLRAMLAPRGQLAHGA